MVVAAFAVGPLAGAGPAPKVDVCHYDADAGLYHKINVSENAFPAHVEHGDGSPGEAVPGTSAYKFDADCNVYQHHIATGEFYSTNYSGALAFAFDLYQMANGDHTGTASYAYTVNSWYWDIAITGACVDEIEGAVTVWGTNTGTNAAGFGALTFVDGFPMHARAANTADSAALADFVATQCATPGGPAYGTGFITFW